MSNILATKGDDQNFDSIKSIKCIKSYQVRKIASYYKKYQKSTDTIYAVEKEFH